MATDVERLVVSLEASITKYERAMQRALGQTNNTTRKIEQRFAAMNTKLQSGFDGFGRGIATAFAGAAALRGAQGLIDASTRIQNSLKVTGLAGEDLERVYDSLFSSAQKNMAPVESLATLYSRLGLSQKELGVTTDELLNFTDNIALALRVQGSTAQESSGALIQLSQAMGSGIVRAEEFNSVLEGAPTILRATAAGLTEAGGSVAKLRALVIEGKVTSEAFFRAFEAGSVILKEQVANAEVTISQGFVRLQNVLIDTAGKFDNATNASSRIGGALVQLAGQIEQAGRSADENGPAINRLLDFVSDAGNRLGDSMFAGTVSEFEAIAGAVDSVAGSFDRYGASVTDAELATAQAEQALVNFAQNSKGQFGELDAVVQDLIQQLLEGRGTAESAAEAIAAIGGAGNFGPLIGQLGGLVSALFAVRSEAVATVAAVAATAAGQSTRSNISDQRAEQQGNRPKPVVKPVSLADYKAPVAASGGGGRGGGSSGGGGGASGSNRFGDALKDRQREIDELNRETAARRELGAAYDENGFAAERLRVQLDLENEAARAGLELTPARQAAINELADGYARASVEAEALKRSQDLATEAMENFADAAETGIRGFIDDLIAGKSATEALGNALASIGNALLSFGLDSLFGFFKPGGGGLSALFPGREAGGPVRKGQPYIVGEKRPELFVPNQSGTIVPRVPSMPKAGAGMTAGGQSKMMVELSPDLVARVLEQAAGQSVQISDQRIKSNNKNMQGMILEMNQRSS